MNQKQWRELLNKSSITKEEWKNAHDHSNWWCTCAVGALTLDDESLIPSDINDTERFLDLHKETQPQYGTELDVLGNAFHEAIKNHDQGEALHIYSKIALIV